MYTRISAHDYQRLWRSGRPVKVVYFTLCRIILFGKSCPERTEADTVTDWSASFGL